MSITWGAVCRAKQGQSISGDVYVVREYAEGHVLISIIDGLGGGSEAERAARLAAQLLEQYPDYPLQDLIRRSHTALHSTRGAVIGLLRLEQESARPPMSALAISVSKSTAASRSNQFPRTASWASGCRLC